jgi:flagellar basal-body rod modification protein FlgD
MSDISATGATTATTTKEPTATLPPGDKVPSSSSSSTSNLSLNGMNSDTFLQLLVAQMKFQNPDNPVDSTQFLAQTAAFEEVQELGSLQTSLSSLVSAQQAGTATSMLGQQVTGSDDSGNPVSGTVTGVQLTSSGPVLTVGNDTLPFSSVTSVAQGSSSTSRSTPTSSTPTSSTGSS